MMKIEFTGPAFAVIQEIREFVAGFEREADCPPLPIAPEAFAAALDATTGEPPKKRGRPKKQPVEQAHQPTVAALPEVEVAIAEKEQIGDAKAQLVEEIAALDEIAAKLEPEPVPDLDAIKAAFRAYANTNGIEAASALLAEFGINKPSELATDELKIEFYQRVSA